MTEAVFIEPGTAVHTTLLAALHQQCFKDPWSVEAISSLLVTPGTVAFLATEGQTDQPVGFVLARIVVDEGEILSIGVLDHARSRGIGAALIAQVVQVDGLGALFLDVAADNESALRLYAKEGFQVVGRRAAYYARGSDARVDSLTMKRDLG
ncbi:MAG: alanine acetyltransferase [Rhodobiaceae bacterium]|nr:MAG: alanine acetyltransferase [Rhodobiaceae bacterium]